MAELKLQIEDDIPEKPIGAQERLPAELKEPAREFDISRHIFESELNRRNQLGLQAGIFLIANGLFLLVVLSATFAFSEGFILNITKGSPLWVQILYSLMGLMSAFLIISVILSISSIVVQGIGLSMYSDALISPEGKFADEMKKRYIDLADRLTRANQKRESRIKNSVVLLLLSIITLIAFSGCFIYLKWFF